jgi:hypothetical protein
MGGWMGRIRSEGGEKVMGGQAQIDWVLGISKEGRAIISSPASLPPGQNHIACLRMFC